jgi:GMP synthase PP-ATPase subunit
MFHATPTADGSYVLQKRVSSRTDNQVRGINDMTFDFSGQPRATIASE